MFAGFKPQRTLIFGFGHDEEVGGSKGAAHLAELLSSRYSSLEFIWDEGSGIAVGGVNPFITEPGAGAYAVDITCEGRALVSSSPGLCLGEGLGHSCGWSHFIHTRARCGFCVYLLASMIV